MQKMRLEDIAGEQKSLTEESEGYRKELVEKLEDWALTASNPTPWPQPIKPKWTA